MRLTETPVEVAERQREPHLIFAHDQRRISGSGGCNRLTGSFELDGDKLHLGRMAGTMMACRRFEPYSGSQIIQALACWCALRPQITQYDPQRHCARLQPFG